MAKRGQPEKEIVYAILEYLWATGEFAWMNDSVGIYDPKKGVFRKRHGKYHRNGVADILGIFKGWPLAIEVKTKIGRPTETQKEFLHAFELSGGIAFIARSVDDVIKKLSKFPTRDEARMDADQTINH